MLGLTKNFMCAKSGQKRWLVCLLKGGEKVKCLECSMKIGEVPEDAKYEEMLCNGCYENFEKAQNELDKEVAANE